MKTQKIVDNINIRFDKPSSLINRKIIGVNTKKIKTEYT